MFFINKYGRKTNLRLILLLFAVGWTVILVSNNLANLIVGLTLCGVASGEYYGKQVGLTQHTCTRSTGQYQMQNFTKRERAEHKLHKRI